ncbi:hypothetical protein QR680_003195 [Steinernema hermaphroditum]|uniref:Arrestin C-terminal-like domain-containing protein n=1 Tax=Steinernema hermaphroditum TaxID=289476 RepID=A0AA39H8C1_9BILA|nr:hypothetical protein QR680_003195 [Steinernema hermaphroditum]
MKIDHFDVVLSKDSDQHYIGGDNVQGKIEVNVSEKVQISRLSVRLHGQTQTSWRNKNSDVVYESKELVLSEYADLTRELFLHCDDDFFLSEGFHTIAFQIPLPLDVISSIERENHGWVRYTCTAVLDIPENGASEIVAEKNFQVYSLLNLDAPHFRQSATSREQVEVVGCCCRRPRGNVSVQMTIAETGLLPGETTQITLIIENDMKRGKKHKESHECVLLSLCQQLDFRSQNRYELHLFDRKALTIAVESHGTCKATPGKGPETKFVNFKVPEDLPPTSIKANGLITCSYFFKLDMDHFDVIVPVVIGTVKTPGLL